MAGIGGDDATGGLLAIEREHVGFQLIAPEGVLESPPQFLGGITEPRRPHVVAKRACQLRRVAFGGVDVALYLAQRDRAGRDFTVGMKDRVAGIFPALIGEPGGALTLIFDKPVTIRVAVSVYPQ